MPYLAPLRGFLLCLFGLFLEASPHHTSAKIWEIQARELPSEQCRVFNSEHIVAVAESAVSQRAEGNRRQ